MLLLLSTQDSGLRTSIRVRLFVRQVAVSADELDFDFAALASLLLDERPLINDILLSQILRDLAEGFE